MSLTVKFSDRFVAERRYVFEVLLGEFLGLAYTVQIEPGVDGYLLELPNGRRLRIRDAFFGDPRRLDRLHRLRAVCLDGFGPSPAWPSHPSATPWCSMARAT